MAGAACSNSTAAADNIYRLLASATNANTVSKAAVAKISGT
jgi:hypothetical protein